MELVSRSGEGIPGGGGKGRRGSHSFHKCLLSTYYVPGFSTWFFFSDLRTVFFPKNYDILKKVKSFLVAQHVDDLMLSLLWLWLLL